MTMSEIPNDQKSENDIALSRNARIGGFTGIFFGAALMMALTNSDVDVRLPLNTELPEYTQAENLFAGGATVGFLGSIFGMALGRRRLPTQINEVVVKEKAPEQNQS